MGEMAGVPDDVDRYADFLLRQEEVRHRVPEAVWRDLDQILLRGPGDRPPLDQVWRDLRLKTLYGVTLRKWRQYVRVRLAVEARVLSAHAIRPLTVLLSIPTDKQREMQDGCQLMLLSQLTRLLEQEDLSSDLLLKVADALSRQRMAAIKADAQRTNERKVKAQTRSAATEQGVDWTRDVGERVRRLYGIHLPAIKRSPDPPGPDSSGRAADPNAPTDPLPAPVP